MKREHVVEVLSIAATLAQAEIAHKLGTRNSIAKIQKGRVELIFIDCVEVVRQEYERLLAAQKSPDVAQVAMSVKRQQ